MTKLQIGVLLSAIAFFFALYFGCDIKPKEQQAIEKSRVIAAESASIEVLLREAKKDIGPAEASAFLALEQSLAEAQADSARSQVLKTISGRWYEYGYPAIAGHYAEQVAELDNSEESWSIAGTTYTICLQRTEEERLRNFCTGRAVKSYENAISINPANPAHQVNLALVYTEHPPQDNPMRGIQMLLDLNQSDPDNVLVLNSLGRLAIRTGQFDRAVERLERAASIEPENRNTICLLAQAYEGAGPAEKAQQYGEQCRRLLSME